MPNRRKTKRTETDLVRECIAVLHRAGCLAWRANTGAVVSEYKGKRRLVRFGPRGQPDIIGVMPDGRFLAVECKMENKSLTDIQVAFLEQLRSYHARVFVTNNSEHLMSTVMWFVRECRKPSHLEIPISSMASTVPWILRGCSKPIKHMGEDAEDGAT